VTAEVDAIRRACEAVLAFFYEEDPPRAEKLASVANRFDSDTQKVVVLGVEGAWRGNLVLMFPCDHLQDLSTRFMGMDLGLSWEEAIDDVLLELGNQIAARACRELEELGLGRTDLTPPSLIQASGSVRLGWNLQEVVVLGLRKHLRIAIGLAPGPRHAQPQSQI
jgi:CheY-specific phosphatase CheX